MNTLLCINKGYYGLFCKGIKKGCSLSIVYANNRQVQIFHYTSPIQDGYFTKMGLDTETSR